MSTVPRPILRPSFVQAYGSRSIPWGFPTGPNYLGELIYRRTYERDGEGWIGTLERVINGAWDLVQRHCRTVGLSFARGQAEGLAEEMFERAFTFQWLPPGRGLWMAGTDFVRDRTAAGLFNCAFVSTKDIGSSDPSRPFCFLMDMSMLGVGVGFDTRGAGKRKWLPVDSLPVQYVIPDTREGWVESMRRLLLWGFGLGSRPSYIYSEIRPAGLPIRGFGGKSSGPGPLKDLHESIEELIWRRRDSTISVTDIVDVMNLEGVCVVAGNVRRTAEIVLGDPTQEFLDLKNYTLNPQRAKWGWTSNNTCWCRSGMDYSEPSRRTSMNGEPGYAWLEHMRNYGRMVDEPNFKDYRALGTNPCGEQTLESYELCDLVENFPSHHDSLKDYSTTLKLSYIYAKAIHLSRVHDPWTETREVMARNRRVGSSKSGVTDFIVREGMDSLIHWSNVGYQKVCETDRLISGEWKIPESNKKTSIKPSGTVSLPAGVRPGAHYQTHRYFLRRIRYANNHPDLPALISAGYPHEPAVTDAYSTVVEFPGEGNLDAPTEQEVSAEDKLKLAVLLQAWWADNQVSCTVTFDRSTEGSEIPNLLRKYDCDLKAISFLPIDPTAYPQMPYSAITKEEYNVRISKIRPVVWNGLGKDHHAEEERYCDGATCGV